MHNLAARVLTATALGSFVVYGILRLPFAVMAGFILLMLFAAALEWAPLAGIVSPRGRFLYAVTTLGIVAALGPAWTGNSAALPATLLVAGCWWVVALGWIVHYQRTEGPRGIGWVPLAVCGWFVLLPAVAALLYLLDRRPLLLLAVLGLVWSADILAFFGGRRWGRRRLASHVSPGKTWEGLLTALLGTPVLVLLGAHLLDLRLPFTAVPMVAATLIAAVVGDLLESLLKRLLGVKDSGTLLPGHGGVLDRIDSVLAAAPIFTLGLIVLERP